MVTLSLTEQERDILIRTLDEYLGELRMEIRDTEKWDYKAGLKNEEEALNRILTDLRWKKETEQAQIAGAKSS